MAQIMYELADMMGFNFQATTFPELFYFVFMGTCSVAIMAGIIKAILYAVFSSRGIAR